MKTILTLCLFPLLFLSLELRGDDNSNPYTTDFLYPIYLADPYEIGFHILLRSYDKLSIPQTSSSHWDLMAAAPFILYEQRDDNDSQYGWQLIFFGGIRGQFDHGTSQDNVAWEGMFGFESVFRYHDNFAWRFGVKHYSSHIGDEYIERTGRSRVGYTREELRAGFAWGFNEQTTFYSDIAYAYTLRNKALQDHGRLQMGLQYEKPNVFLDGKVGWYSALDITAYEEDAWDRNITFQVGFEMPAYKRRWRLGLEYYDGRSQYGEFFQNRDRYIGVGFWIGV